ncbi:MAG TPA: ABC transporter permease subunit [Acidimicrobiales bacterium]|nr:ABC transporter permease subunit [Acidimicrobiales bacterium]
MPAEPVAAAAARRVVPPLVLVAVLAAAWQLVAASNPYLLPRPSATLAQLADHPGTYLDTARATVVEAALGLLVGGAVAVALAVATVQSRLVEGAVMPLAVALNVTPVVAVGPALVVALGFGIGPKVILTGLIVFFTVFATTRAGLRSVDPELLDVLRVLHATRTDLLVRVQLPAAVPAMLTGLRVALPLSVVGAVVAEFVAPGSSGGLGTLITTARAYSNLSVVYAAIVCLAVLGIAVTAAVSAVERTVRRRRGVADR